MASIFETLNAVNVNDKTERKKAGGAELTYLSWPWAWAEVKRRYPEAHYTIWKDQSGKPYAYDAQTGYMVYTTVTIGNESHDMWLPVMDGANNAMKSEPYDYTVRNPKFRYAKWNKDRNAYIDSFGNEQPEILTKHVEAATMFDVNKAIMRCLVKNLAMFGLGLYIYAGEDLPDGENDGIQHTGSKEAAQEAGKRKLEQIDKQLQELERETPCERCGQIIKGTTTKGGKVMSALEIIEGSRKTYNGTYCLECMSALKKKRSETEKAQ